MSPADRRRLEALVGDRNVAQKHVWRARIVLHSADGIGTNGIMRRTGKSKTCVWRWQERFAQEGYDGLLRDKTRPSRIPPLGPEVAERVVALTLSDPPAEATHWVAAMMAKATGISVSSVQRIWRAHGLRPHRVRQFKLSNDPDFVAKLRDVVGLYVDPPAHAIVLSVDEKSQIQALDRTQPGLPMKKGRLGTMTMSKLGAFCIERGRARLGIGRRGKRMLAGGLFTEAVGANRKNGKHGIADKSQHLSTMSQDGAGRAIKIAVDGFDKGLRCQFVGQFCRLPKVAEPNNRMNFLPIAQFDLAVHNLFAGVWAEIGGQNITGDLFLDGHLAGKCQPLLNTHERPDVTIVEAARPVGRPGTSHTAGLIGPVLGAPETHKIGEIVRPTPLAKILQYGEIDLSVGTGQPAAQMGNIVFDNVCEGAVQPYLIHRYVAFTHQVWILQPAISVPCQIDGIIKGVKNLKSQSRAP